MMGALSVNAADSISEVLLLQVTCCLTRVGDLYCFMVI